MKKLASTINLARLLPKAANVIRVPADLASVTQVDTAGECDPRDVGLEPAQVSAIWGAIEDLYRTGLQPGMSLALRRHGKLVLHRAIGHARGNGPEDAPDTPTLPMRLDTPVCLFSASKAITGMLVHKLAEDGRLRLRDRIADYVPEYGVRGKEKTTLLNMLSHRGGIPTIPFKEDPDPRMLQDWDSIVQMLCAAKPMHLIGWVQAYHAITAGFVLGEVIRRVTGRELRDVITESFRQPLGLRHFNYGLDEAGQDIAAYNYFTGAPLKFPLSYVAKRVLGVSFEEVTRISNETNYMTAVVPAGNIYATADEACRFFQMMLNGGELDGVRVFEPRTLQKATRPAGVIQVDRSLMVPMRFSAGMMMGEWPAGLYGYNCPQAFGHLGFISIVCWADPARDISGTFLTTGKSMALESLLGFYKVMLAISNNCPPVPGAQRPAWTQMAV